MRVLWQSPLAYLQKLADWSPKSYGNARGPEIALWSNKNQIEGLIHNINTFCKTIIKTVWNQYKDNHTDQWERTESLEINTTDFQREYQEIKW